MLTLTEFLENMAKGSAAKRLTKQFNNFHSFYKAWWWSDPWHLDFHNLTINVQYGIHWEMSRMWAMCRRRRYLRWKLGFLWFSHHSLNSGTPAIFCVPSCSFYLFSIFFIPHYFDMFCQKHENIMLFIAYIQLISSLRLNTKQNRGKIHLH